MGDFLRQAEDILDTAVAGQGRESAFLVIERSGGIRMLEAAGWSPAGVASEYGAAAVYRIERRDGAVRVEGWSGSQRCLIEQKTGARKLLDLPFQPACCALIHSH